MDQYDVSLKAIGTYMDPYLARYERYLFARLDRKLPVRGTFTRTNDPSAVSYQ